MLNTFFMYLLNMCISSMEKCLCMCFAHFVIILYVFAIELYDFSYVFEY